MAKPTLLPVWSANNNPLDNIEPIEAFKLGGVQSGNPWGRENLNWQFYALYQWVDWIKNDGADRTANLSDLTSAAQALTNLGLQNPSTLIKANTEGNAATATKLKTKRKINGVDFDGSANITITATPNSHTHGAISNDGKIGSTANLPIITGAGGALKAGAFGSTANTFTEGNDSRLSNSREWIGSTVPQDEAETGTSGTRRAWTAQRVRQAITAWWGGVGAAWGRGFVGSTSAADGRSKLGLGDASTKTVGVDTGNLMEVGAFGYGNSINLGTQNLNDITTAGLYHQNQNANALAIRNYPTLNAGSLVVTTAAGIVQEYTAYGNVGEKYTRGWYASAWSPWVRYVNSRNLASSTGNSTATAMSQKAVTDAVASKSNGVLVSPEYTIAANTRIEWSHGQGRLPMMYQPVLICKSAEHGYGAGNVAVNFAIWDRNQSGYSPITCISSTNRIGVAFGDSTILVTKYSADKGADNVKITPWKWKVQFRAIF